MAPPEVYESVKNFNPSEETSKNNFLPLMQSNDVFIVSAIMKGLIDKVVWVRPTWLADSNHTVNSRGYVGVTKLNGSNELSPCSCQQFILKKRKKKTSFECYVFNREKDLEITVPLKDCKLLKSYMFIMISEEKFLTKIKLNNIEKLFVDIDEDFFGVESGVQNHINRGISLETIDTIQETFPSIFCPKTNQDEHLLDKAIRNFFQDITLIKLKQQNTERINLRREFSKAALSRLSQHACSELDNILLLLNSFADIVYLFDIEELKVLSKSRFCLINSPQLQRTPEFSLCHGNIFPNDPLNQIYVSSKNEITERGKSLTNILRTLYQYKTPSLYTISRSLRDGYTPRHQQRFIEEIILESITIVLDKYKAKSNVIYDKYLLFGKEGWL